MLKTAHSVEEFDPEDRLPDGPTLTAVPTSSANGGTKTHHQHHQPQLVYPAAAGDAGLAASRDGYESSMRLATDISADDRRNRRRNRRRKIRARRGAFQFLPVHCSNDLVHGSWWFVLGSVIATLIPIVPLVDLFYPFWKSTPRLPILSDAATFGLLIASGFFFTIGSLAFVRATEEPPLQPLFANVSVHLETDELLAAWLFLIATIPYPIFMAVYIHFNPHVLFYWGVLFASLLFVVATYFFVLTCYPSNEGACAFKCRAVPPRSPLEWAVFPTASAHAPSPPHTHIHTRSA